jgi:hypothetical protein
LAIFLLLPLVCSAQTTQPADGEWKPLFNGNNLDGWYTFLKDTGKNDDPKKIFQIEEGGVIHIYKDAEQGSQVPYGYLCTEKEYGDCRVRLQYRWGEKRFGSRVNHVRDSGLLYFVWGEDGKGNGVWPFSIECQIQENDVGDTYAIGNNEASTQVIATVDPATLSGKAPTWMDGPGAVPYTSPATGNNRIVRSKMLEKDGWNTVEVELQSDTARHIVNGTCNMKLFNITRPDPNDPSKRLPVRKGRILIQAEGAEVMYRNIEIAPLK